MFETLSLWTNTAIFAGSAIAVWLAGARLARHADKIAEKTGLGRELLGMLLQGGLTPLPELAVAVSATVAGAPVLSISTVLGSAAANMVVLAGADALFGRPALTATPATAETMLQGVLGIVLLALVIGAHLGGDRLFWGMGAWSWLLLAAFLGMVWLMSKSQGLKSWVPVPRHDPGPRPDGGQIDQEFSMRSLVLRTAAASVVILVAGFLLANSGEALAWQTGLGTSFFGAVLLGLSTSLSEISTVFAAVRLRRYEMAMGNVFGANLFNTLIIVVVDAIHPGAPVLVEAGRFAAFAALLAIVLTALFLVGMMERRDRTVLRMGIDSLGVLVCYSAGVAMLYQLR